MKYFSVGLVSVLLLAACGRNAADVGEALELPLGSGEGASGAPNTPASQCGPSWDVQNVETYDGSLGVPVGFVNRYQRQVGYLLGPPGCTGTLISNDLLITGRDCGYEGTVVRFNFQNAPDGSPRPPSHFTVVAVVERETAPSASGGAGNGGPAPERLWDYAILRLDRNPGLEFGHATIAASDPVAGSTVAIMQHPHFVPKVVHAATILDYSSPVGANWLRHRVDTDRVSTGAALLNTAGQIVAIHTDGGCNTLDPIQGNSAMRMSRLVEHSPTLRGLVRGSMIVSDTNSGLALNAVGGAVHGAFVQLHSGCTATNPDCTWTYRDGMLLSDRDQTLAINAWGGAAHGTQLRLHNGCTAGNPDCTWTLKNGAFYSDANPALAINAMGGAQHGTQLGLFEGCPLENTDCTWTYRNVMLRSSANYQLGMNAFGGAAIGTDLQLNQQCAADNPDCTFTISHGQFLSDADASLAVNAFGGAMQLTQLKLHNGCAAGNPDCTWTVSAGMIRSDANVGLAVNAFGGAVSGAPLVLHGSCAAGNPDCTFALTSN